MKDGNAKVCGEGKGKTEDEAMVMAMCDAILESGAKVWVAVKNENAKLAEHSARMEARGAIVSCEWEKKDAPGGAVAASGLTNAITQAIVEELILILVMIILTGIIVGATVSDSIS